MESLILYTWFWRIKHVGVFTYYRNLLETSKAYILQSSNTKHNLLSHVSIRNH